MSYSTYPYGPFGPFDFPFDPNYPYYRGRDIGREIREAFGGGRGGFRDPSPYNPSGEMRGVGMYSDHRRIDRYPLPYEDDRYYTRGGSCGGSGAFRGQSLSPDNFAASDTSAPAVSNPLEMSVLGELSRCAKVLRDLGADLNSSDLETRKTAHENAKAQFYYTCGLLYSRGIFMPQETLTRGSSTPTRAGDGCERLGREIDRLLGGRGGDTFKDLGREFMTTTAKDCYRGLKSYDPATGDLPSAGAGQPVAADGNLSRGSARLRGNSGDDK